MKNRGKERNFGGSRMDKSIEKRKERKKRKGKERKEWEGIEKLKR